MNGLRCVNTESLIAIEALVVCASHHTSVKGYLTLFLGETLYNEQEYCNPEDRFVVYTVEGDFKGDVSTQGEIIFSSSASISSHV